MGMVNSYMLDRHVSYLKRSVCCVCVYGFSEWPGQHCGIKPVVSEDKGTGGGRSFWSGASVYFSFVRKKKNYSKSYLQIAPNDPDDIKLH